MNTSSTTNCPPWCDAEQHATDRDAIYHSTRPWTIHGVAVAVGRVDEPDGEVTTPAIISIVVDTADQFYAEEADHIAAALGYASALTRVSDPDVSVGLVELLDRVEALAKATS